LGENPPCNGSVRLAFGPSACIPSSSASTFLGIPIAYCLLPSSFRRWKRRLLRLLPCPCESEFPFGGSRLGFSAGRWVPVKQSVSRQGGQAKRNGGGLAVVACSCELPRFRCCLLLRVAAISMLPALASCRDSDVACSCELPRFRCCLLLRGAVFPMPPAMTKSPPPFRLAGKGESVIARACKTEKPRRCPVSAVWPNGIPCPPGRTLP